MDIAGGCPHIDFTSDEMKEDLYGVLRQLRDTCPVVHTSAHGGYWVLTRHEDVLTVLQDWATFTSTRGVVIPQPESPLRALPMESDPPEQRAYRNILNPFLTPAAAKALEPDIRTIIDSYIDRFESDGRCELVADLAQHVPSLVLFRLLLGADEAEIPGCHEAVINFAYDPTSPSAIAGAMHLMQFCYGLLQARKDQAPRDDIVDAILGCQVVDRPITDLEAVGVVALLIFGGFDTTANAIASAIVLLAQRPDLQDAMRRDPARIGQAIEEFLRYDPPIIGLARRATRDVELGGQLIRAGDPVYFSIAGANRDPSEFPDPDSFDPGRPQNRHLTFSGGTHRCVGSNLARVMLRVALEQLLGRLDDIALAGPVEYYQAAARGPKSVPITFRSRALTPS